MDNTTRSERSRHVVIQAALAIIARGGPGRLTLDAIAKEAGISKGGLMHQFHSKQDVLKALLQHQAEYFENFSRDYMASAKTTSEPLLAAEIAIAREAIGNPQAGAVAMVGVMGEDLSLVSMFKETDARKLAAIRAEAADPDLAVLRWSAARGLAMTALMGICPLSQEEREGLFERLLDTRKWSPRGLAKKNN